MFTTVASLVLAAGLSMSTTATDNMPINMGEYRITTYCQYCNQEVGYESASGRTLRYGHVAMNDVPLGSVISIDGEEFVVTDRCGIPGTVDIFVPTDSGGCHCNTLEYKNVYLIRGEVE